MKKDHLETQAASVAEEHAEDSGALYILGTRYSTGRDVEQDLIAAHKWFNLAAMMGHEDARLCRAELAREMSAADIADAQRQARAWLWVRANGKTTVESSGKAATPLAADTKPAAEDSRGRESSNRSLCA